MRLTGFKPTFGVLSSEGILKGEQADPAILKFSTPSIIARTADDIEAVFSVLSGRQATALAQPRIAIAGNFTATAFVAQAFEAAIAIVRSQWPDLGSADLPFDEVAFDISHVDAARDAIGKRLFSDRDLIILPTLAAEIPTVEQAKAAGDQAVSPANTFFANYFGLPALSISTAFDGKAGPTSLQILGAPGADGLVLAFGKALQALFPQTWLP